MIDVRIDEPISLQPEKKRPPKGRAWLIRGAFLASHLALIGGLLAWLYLPQFSAWFRPAGSGPAPIARPNLASTSPPMRPSPSPSPRPNFARKDDPPLKSNSPARPRQKDDFSEGQSAPGGEPSPRELLESRGLVKSDAGYTLRDEALCVDHLGKAKQAFKQGQAITALLQRVQLGDNYIAEVRKKLIVADAEVSFADNHVQSLSRPMNNVETDYVNQCKAELKRRRDDQTAVRRELELCREQSPGPPQRRQWTLEKEKLEAAYQKEIAELRRLVDSTVAKREALARDEAVKSALRNLRESLNGPSDRFSGITEELVLGEEYIRQRTK